MAKFKKKKSKPTPEPEDTDKEVIENDASDIPEIEKSESTPEPSKESKISAEQKNDNDKKLNKLFWLRVALGVISGAASTFLFESIEGEERRWASIGFLIIVFIGTIVFAKGMKMQLPSSDRKKIVTQGIGSFIFLFLFTWIVTYTLVHTATVSSGINI